MSGLMARHILQGERPIFYYGQDYMGVPDSYVAALLFAVAGSSTFVFRLVPIAFSMVFCATTYILGRRIYGQLVGVVAAAYVAVSPLFLTIWSAKGRTHYVETLAFGGLLLILLLDVAYDRRREAWRPVALGLIAGLALWTNLLVLSYLLVAVALLVLRPGVDRLRVAALALPSFLLGSLPLWLANVPSGFPTFGNLTASNSDGLTGLLAIPRHLAGLVLQAAPVLLGWVQPISNLDGFAAERAAMPAAFAAGALVFCALIALATYRLVEVARAGWSGLLAQRDLPLLALFFTAALLFAAGKTAPLQYGEPRYVMSLYSTAPIFAAFVRRLGKRSGLAMAVALAAMVAFNLQSTLGFDPGAGVPVVGGQPLPTSNARVISFLLERGDTRIYADYWIAYSVAFESEERIVAGVVGDDLRRGFNRYIPYAQQVDDSPSPAWVFVEGAPQARAFEERLRRQPAAFERSAVGGYVVYDRIDPPLRPAE